MGCDLHCIVQIYKKKQWTILDCELIQDRSYPTFSVLADVRGQGDDFIALPKGLPEDLSHIKDNKYYIGEQWLGNHSHSYYTLNELLKTNVSFEHTYLWQWVEVLLTYKRLNKLSLEHIRVVFGFDS